MTDYVSVAGRSSLLFNQPLIASLLQPLGKNQQDYKAYRTRVNLKITEHRNENSGEKELKFEISRSDDFEFLFAEILNNEKYQKLAREHDLIVDFDAFPRAIIQKLLCKNIASLEDDETKKACGSNNSGPHSIVDGKPTEITLILDADKTICSFELFSKTPISKGRIFSLKLAAVRGDQLTSHLLRICSNNATKLADLKKMAKELEEIQEEVERLRKENGEMKENQEKYKTDEERIEELEDELELVKEERQNMRMLAEEKEELVEKLRNENEVQLEDLKDELDVVGTMLGEQQDKNERLQKERDTLRREVADLRKENSILSRNLDKSSQLLKKQDQAVGQQSVDLRKLKELEVDLKEKDELIHNLTGAVESLRKESEEDKRKLGEMEQTVKDLRATNTQLTMTVGYYRNGQLSPHISGGALANSSTPGNVSAVNPFGRFASTSTTPRYIPPYQRTPSINGLSTPHGLATPQLQVSPYTIDSPTAMLNPTTPNPLRNVSNFLPNDTTISTNTPVLQENAGGK